jgi:DNA-binding response OmpR family regulator
MRLLLIADDEQIAEIIAAAMVRMGYTVESADGRRSSGWSLENRPYSYDLVLIDASHQTLGWRKFSYHLSRKKCRGASHRPD